MPVPRTQPDCTSLSATRTRGSSTSGFSHAISIPKLRPCDPTRIKTPAPTSPCTPNPSASTPTLQPQVSTTQVGTHNRLLISYPTKGVQVPPCREPTLPSVQIHALDVVYSRSPRLVVLPVVRFGTAQTCWTRPPSQCRQRSRASPISTLCSAMESRTSAQEPHPDHSSDLWTHSRSHLTRSQ